MADTTTTTTPVTNMTPPTTATTQQVAQHHSVLQTVIASLESLPQSAENAEKYLDMKSQLVTTWVQAKHVKTRLLEVAGIVLAVGTIIGFIVGRFL